MIEKIRSLSEKYFKNAVETRRHLHSHPELSFQEKETSDYIFKELNSIGINVKRIANTGIIAEINGKEKGKVIALRADIDALPINEDNDVSYKSVQENVMHACGHDVHTASLLTVAKILNQLKEEFTGTIKLIFQPAEEKIPGGAQQIIEEGGLKNPDVDIIFGQHVDPDLETGTVGFKANEYMASSDEFYISVFGKGGHAAMPWKLIDPVAISAQLITSLQTIISRNTNVNSPSVLSFGKITSLNGAVNIIPNEVKIEGIFRTFNEEWRKEAHKLIISLCENIVKGMGAKAKIKIIQGYPVLINDEEQTKKSVIYAQEYLGKKNVIMLERRMTAEDFAYYSLKKTAVYYRLGTANKSKGIDSPLHSSTFNVDEDSLKTSIGLMTYLALKSL